MTLAGRSWRALALSAAALLCAGRASLTAQFVVPEGSNFHNGANLPLGDDGTAQEAIRTLRAALSQDAADEAASVMRALRHDRHERLLPLSARVDAPALELAARLLVAGGDSPSLQRVLAELRAEQAAARAARDLPVLLDHATRGVALPTAGEAALSAARLLYEQGRWWEAASLAARASALPGAAELAAAARARLAALAPAEGHAPDGPASARRWTPAFGKKFPLDEDMYAGLPLIVDGRDKELLYLDAFALVAFSSENGKLTQVPFDWGSHLLNGGRDGLDLPAASRHALVRAGDLIVTTMNALKMPRADDVGHRERAPTIPRVARLVCLRFAEGAQAPFTLLWSATPPDADEPSASAAFGPPLIASDRVFALLYRTSLLTDVSLTCFALDDGRLLFDTPLTSAAQIKRFGSRLSQTSVNDQDKRPGEAALAERDGIVYACTGYGVFAAVDGLTGHLRHCLRYDRVFSMDPDTYDPAFLFDTGGWDDEPVRLWPGRVVIAPSDSRYLYILADEPGPNGQLILDDPIERLDRLNVAGLLPDPQGRPSPAVLATRRRTDRGGAVLLGPDGHVLATSPPFTPEQTISGRPLLLGSRLLVPTLAGVVSCDPADLSAPPEVLPHATVAPVGVAGLFPVHDGLATLSPLATGGNQQSYWYLLWYAPAP